MLTQDQAAYYAQTLRNQRLAAGVKPSEINAEAYRYESACALHKRTPKELINIQAAHQKAVEEARIRKETTTATQTA